MQRIRKVKTIKLYHHLIDSGINNFMNTESNTQLDDLINEELLIIEENGNDIVLDISFVSTDKYLLIIFKLG